jgi:predicted Zn-dependent protease
MAEIEALTSFKQGVQLLKSGYSQKALVELRRCVEIESSNPYYLSFLGVAIARSEKKWAEAYVGAGQRESAIETLDRARESFGPDARLVKARSRIEKRRAPILPFLDRQNALNKSLGKLRHRASKRVAAG